MEKEEQQKIIAQRLEYLYRYIAPDDIYLFAQQVLFMAQYFASEWLLYVDLEEECDKCEIAKNYITSLSNFLEAQVQNKPIKFKPSFDDEDHFEW